MACTVDHLSADHHMEVIREFVDARGTKHAAGDRGIIRRIELDWPRQELLIEWERVGKMETMYFSLSANSGPRNGRMREFFAVGDYAPVPREKPSRRRRKSGSAVELPELNEMPVTDVAQYSEAVQRVWALAGRKRFAAAEEQCRLITASPDPFDGRLEQLAGDLVAIAVAHAPDADETVYRWARRQAIHLWYAWGSGATSGGEGEVRAMKIRAAEAELARCEAERAG